MNAAVLNTSAVGVIALAVSSALWLANSVQGASPAAPRIAGLQAAAAPIMAPKSKPLLLAAALPAERAASASLVHAVGVR